MQRSNLHTHSSFSDGHNTAEEMISEAIQRGFTAIGFSDHSFTPDQVDCAVPPDREAERKRELSFLKEKYAGIIAVYDGVEIDFHTDRCTFGWDYSIGSVHEMTVDGVTVQIDDGEDRQRDMIRGIFGGDSVKMAMEYYRCVAEHIRTNRPDIVGHFDLPTKYSLVDENDPRYLEAALTAARECAKYCPTFEMNTGAIVRNLRKVPYPAPYLIDEIKACGGRFVITSDCHYRERMTLGFDIAEEILSSHGFKKNENGELNPTVRGIEIWE